jgi:hypothetical protein
MEACALATGRLWEPSLFRCAAAIPHPQEFHPPTGDPTKSDDYGMFNCGLDGPVRIPRSAATRISYDRLFARPLRVCPASPSRISHGLGKGKWCPGKDSNLHGR